MSTHQQPLLVAAAIIRQGEQILIAQRLPDAKSDAGRWEFPGGKIERGEHPEECLIREIKEELNLEVQVEEFFALNSHIDSQVERSEKGVHHVVLLAYLCRWIGGELKLLDAADARWVAPSELAQFQWAEADIPIVRKITSALAQ